MLEYIPALFGYSWPPPQLLQVSHTVWMRDCMYSVTINSINYGEELGSEGILTYICPTYLWTQITLEQFQLLVAWQSGLCSACWTELLFPHCLPDREGLCRAGRGVVEYSGPLCPHPHPAGGSCRNAERDTRNREIIYLECLVCRSLIWRESLCHCVLLLS